MTSATLATTRTELLTDPNWVIDPVSEARLAHQLKLAPVEVAGVVAPTQAPPPGSSHRTTAERAGLAPLRATTELGAAPEPGAALVRSGRYVQLTHGAVHTEEGTLILDRGATTHDPHRPLTALASADPAGRPPFAWRPLVLFVGLETASSATPWLSPLVDALMGHETESRLALVEAPVTRPRLVEPCNAGPETFAVLSPEVVVTLDTTAAEQVPDWCTERGTVIVEANPGTAGVELVPWDIARARGRVRARMGDDPDPATLADTARRLSNGPQPVAPTVRRVETPVTKAWRPVAPPRAGPRHRPVSVAVSSDAADGTSRRRLVALGEALVAAGHDAGTHATVSELAPSARRAELVVAGGAAVGLDDVVSARRSAGRPTIVDLGAADLLGGPATTALEVAASAGLVTVPTAAARRVLVSALDEAVPAAVIPSLVERAHAAELAGTERRRPDAITVVGWPIDPRRGADPGLASALTDLSGQREDLRVEVTGADPADPTLADRSGLNVDQAPAGPGRIAGWSLQVWDPEPAALLLGGDRTPLDDAAALGVATLVPAEADAALTGAIRPLVVGSAPDRAGWADAIAGLTSDGAVERARIEVAEAWAAMNGPASSAAVINRLLGWALGVPP